MVTLANVRWTKSADDLEALVFRAGTTETVCCVAQLDVQPNVGDDALAAALSEAAMRAKAI